VFDATRRSTVEATIATLRQVWSGSTGGATGFLRPEPPPPVIVGGFCPKMAALAGRLGDGINAPGGPSLPRLLDIARQAHADSGRDPAECTVTTSGTPGDQRLALLGVDRVLTMIHPPYLRSVERLAEQLGRR
jgi:alkanesulfonate monooxygenase SsuD/methylene tetrahydromethanopterin reductase-like flavin-dependent oxidoreductase (luciferase family)